jgi:hypothetical protein
MVNPNANQDNIENRTELPLLGLASIAKSIEIKTDMSSKLTNMLAISANSSIANKATLSTNGDPIGFINTNYTDRYIYDRLGPTTSSANNLDSIKIAATQFNQTISDFYSKLNPSDTNVSQVTGYFIEKMSIIKNNESASRASAMIPVSVNITTDGISGLSMLQAFTIPEQLLPYTYTTKNVGSFIDNYINKVGFAIVGLNHSIEGNVWNTSFRANMITLKDSTIFVNETVKQLQENKGEFTENVNNDGPYSVVLEQSVPIEAKERIKIAKTFFEQKGYSQVQVSAIIGGLLQESQLNPNALNTTSPTKENPSLAYGIAQWLGDRKKNLQSRPNYSSLEVQLKYIIEEFNGLNNESKAGKRIKSAQTLGDAIAAMASYERYLGVGSDATYKDVINAEIAGESGKRIGYTKNIYNTYNNI